MPTLDDIVATDDWILEIPYFQKLNYEVGKNKESIADRCTPSYCSLEFLLAF